MPFSQFDQSVETMTLDRPRRSCKLDTARLFGGVDPCRKSLALDGVMDVLKGYNEYEGGINCSICGKLYKSRVCFTKHLWEHSIYWDLFDGSKNQDRVLSIQAAIILYGGWFPDDKFTDLLVTSPQHYNKPPTLDKSPEKFNPLKRKCENETETRLTNMAASICLRDSNSDIENRYDHDSSSSDESHHENDWRQKVNDSTPQLTNSIMTENRINCVMGSLKRRKMGAIPKRIKNSSISEVESRPN